MANYRGPFPWGDDETEMELVTLLGALLTGNDTIYVGADSCERSFDSASGDVWEPKSVDKLSQIADLPMVWGVYGNAEIGDDFSEYLSTHPPSKWNDMYNYGVHLRGLNRNRPSREPTASLLIAGYLEDRPQIFHIEHSGNASLCDKYQFVGVGRVAARAAFATAKRLQPQVAEPANFTIAFEVTIDQVEGLEGPLSLWKVACDSVEKLL